MQKARPDPLLSLLLTLFFLSIRNAQKLTGFAAADFSRVRNADYGRFTIDRLNRMLEALDSSVEVAISVQHRPHQNASARPA